LADADPKQLKTCKLGFRTERVLETSRIVRNKELDLETLREMDHEKAKRELLALPGVGQKVADCVLLFSLDKLETFPVDVWVKRALLNYYSNCFEESLVRKISPEPHSHQANTKRSARLEEHTLENTRDTHRSIYLLY